MSQSKVEDLQRKPAQQDTSNQRDAAKPAKDRELSDAELASVAAAGDTLTFGNK